MASIQKLSVRGIRSFSPEDSEQVLEFYMPLTVIVGANGCGKTTLIESLKFAVCGAMPPGNKSGQAFVHDPRSIGSSVVKASVKLRFANQAGQTMVVVRSMEVQQKKTSLSFKQLDGVIRTAASGQKKSMSHKCTELDRQVPLMLGVSKAILENVVFCHQEESSWPLQEGAVLKKKFDDIFDSTRYTKALEVFSKLKKEYTMTAKDLKANVMELKSHKHAAQQFQREIDRYNEQLEELEENLASGRQALKENEAEKERVSALQDRLYSVESQIGQKKHELITEKTAINRQQDMLERDMTNDKTLEELQNMLQSFDAEFEGHRKKKREMERKMNEIAKEAEKLRDQQSELQPKIGRLQAAKETHEKNLQARYEKMVEIGTQFGLGDLITQISQNSQGLAVAASQDASFVSAAFGSLNNSLLGSPNSSLLQAQQRPILDISKDDLNDFSKALKRKQEKLQEEQSKLKAQRKAQEDDFNNQISELKVRLNVLESNKRRIEGEKEETADELKEIVEHSSRVPRMREDTVNEAKAKAADAAKKRDEANNNPRRKQIPIEIASLRNKMDAIQINLDKDKEVQEELMEFQKDEAEINEAKISADSEFETLQEEMKESVDPTQFRLFGLDSPPKVLPKRDDDKSGNELQSLIKKARDEIKDKLDEIQSDMEKINESVQNLTEKRDKTSALLDQDKASIVSVKARMTQLQNSVDRNAHVVQKVRTYERSRDRDSDENPFKPDEADPQALLDYLKERLDAIESESTKGVPVAVLKKVMKSLKKRALAHNKCPCCKKKLENDSEAQKMRETLDLLMSDNSPLSKMDTGTKEAKDNLTQWYDEVKKYQNDVAEHFRHQKEANLLETRKAEREKSLALFEEQLKQTSGQAEERNKDVDTAREMLDAWRRWAEAAGRIAGLRAKVSSREASIRQATSDKRDLKQVNSDITKLERQKDEYIGKINALNKEMTDINDDMSSNAQAATRLEKFYRDMQQKYIEELKLGERKKTLKEKEKSLKKEMDNLSDQIEKAKEPIENKEKEKLRSQRSMEEDESILSETYMKFTTSTQELSRIILLIDEYEESNTDNDVTKLLEKSEDLSKNAKAKEKEYSLLKPELDSLAKVVDDQDRERNTVEDNIKLLEAQEKVIGLENDVAALKEDLSRVEGGETVDDDLAQLDERKSELIANIARLEGRRSEVIESIRGLKRKLSQPEYRNVEEQFRVANIKFDTSEMAVKDIEKYHSALDKALQRYHSLKIGEINSIIRDLWALTYKGEDINNIQIISGQESGSRSSRSYNYRVVMEKGGSKMDMRGRCSAGQRVLASIVIRLALAETFCVQFGCIALDEPTVNLDYNNKKGLAVALAQIIASRQAQSNFQLVLITHDEDFVVMMKNELATQTNVSMPEKYFQIRREEAPDGKFYSKIDAIDWEELL